MKGMTPKLDDDQRRLLELTAEIQAKLKLVRDYATTPGNVWLAKNEMSKISTMMSELDEILSSINAAQRG
jgi:hypothetical protein